MSAAKKKRRQRTNLDGQEELVSALYDFAAGVEHTIREGESWLPGQPILMTEAKHRLIGEAMKRTMDGFGYRIVEIQ